MYELIAIYPGESGFNLFAEAEEQLHPGKFTSDKVADLFLHSCYVLMFNGTIVGRFALYDNPALNLHDEKAICIGNYGCVNTAEISSLLLGSAYQKAKEMNAAWLIGPMNGSTWENYRFSDYSREDNFFLEPENPDWYNRQFLENGFVKIASYLSTNDTEMPYEFPQIERRKKELLNEGYIFRPMRLKAYEEELGKIYELSSQAFQNNFLFTPIERNVFIQKYLLLKPHIDPNFVLLAEDKEGELAGFIFCINDIKNKSTKRLILKSVARRSGRQDRGLGDVLACEITQRAKLNGYEGIIHALMHAEGSSINLSKNRRPSIIKTYSLYATRLW
jgi:hypothetical protein